MTDQMREALETIAAYPYSRDQEMGVAAMRKIAREALASAQQADHIGDVSEMVAAPVVPEEWRDLLEELTKAHRHAVMAAHPHRHYPGNMDRFQLDMAVVERAQSLLAAPAPEQRDKVELTDAEIEERWWGELDNRSLSSIRAVLAAYEAKQHQGEE